MKPVCKDLFVASVAQQSSLALGSLPTHSVLGVRICIEFLCDLVRVLPIALAEGGAQHQS